MTKPYKKRKASSTDKKLWLKVPATSKDRLEKIYTLIPDITRTDILIHLIDEAGREYKNRNSGQGEVEKQIREQSEFVDAYILEHFGEQPEDEELAQSEALKAYYAREGYSFDTADEEEGFKLPE